MRRGSCFHLFLLWVAIAGNLFICRIQATQHYCANHSPANLVIDSDDGQSEKLIPTIYGPPESVNQLRCTWKFSAPSTADAVIVLRGYNVTTDARRKRSVTSRHAVAPATNDGSQVQPRMHYQLMVQTESGCSSHGINSTQLKSADSFRVLQLPTGGYLKVTYDQESNLNGTLPPGLMIQLVHKGFCTRDLVNFDGRCYAKMQLSRNLIHELNVINGDSKLVQLASFNSTDAIHQFLVTSQLRVVGSGLEMRSKEPPDLKQPARIGLFYDKKTGSITYLSSADGTCQLKKFQDPEKFPFKDMSANSTHACGSLRVDELSGREVIEFWNCDTPLPALISFAETPSKSCSNCSEPVLDWISAMAGRDSNDINGISLLIQVGISIASISFLIAISVIVRRVLRLKARNASASSRNRIKRIPADVEYSEGLEHQFYESSKKPGRPDLLQEASIINQKEDFTKSSF